MEYEYTEVNFQSEIVKDGIDYISVNADLYLENDSERKVIGNATIKIYNTYKYHYADIREYADSYALHQYQTLSSVRICENPFEAEEFEFFDDGETFDDEIYQAGRQMGISDFGIYEGKRYNPLTRNVYGLLGLITDVKIMKEYRRKGYGKELMNEIIEYCSLMNIDFLLLKPFPTETGHLLNEDKRFDKDKLQIEINNLISFYENLGFEKTIGKTDEVHLVLSLNEI